MQDGRRTLEATLVGFSNVNCRAEISTNEGRKWMSTGIPEQEPQKRKKNMNIIEPKKLKKDISERLKDNFILNCQRFYKLPDNVKLPQQKIEREYEAKLLYSSYKKLIEKNKNKINKNAENIEKIAIRENYSVTSKVKEIFKELSKKPKFVFNKLFSVKAKPKAEVVTAFSGVLELSSSRG